MRTFRERPTLWAAIAFGISLAGYLVVRWLAAPTSIDLAVYRVEGAAIRDGVNLYGEHLPTPLGLRATYPPFAAILFVPISYVGWAAAQVIGVVANLALLLLVCDQACRLARVNAANRLTACLVLAAIALWAEPVFTTLRYGQINLALLALIQWDFLRPGTARTRGLGVGLAAGIKVTPGIFVVYLLLTRRFRMAFTATVTFVLTVALSAAIVPSSTWRFWTKLLWDSDRVGRLEDAANQSIRGVLARLQHGRAKRRAGGSCSSSPRSSPASSARSTSTGASVTAGQCRSARSPACSRRRSRGRITGSGACRSPRCCGASGAPGCPSRSCS